MHTVIRRYEGAEDSTEVARRAVEEFGPMLSERPGFQGYWAVDAGDGVLATITVFETEEAAARLDERSRGLGSREPAGARPERAAGDLGQSTSGVMGGGTRLRVHRLAAPSGIRRGSYSPPSTNPFNPVQRGRKGVG